MNQASSVLAQWIDPFAGAGNEAESRQRPALPIGVRARVWIEARHFFSRADAQQHGWLWLLREDGRVQALRLDASVLGRDDLVGALLTRLDADADLGVFDEPAFGRVWALPHAPVVPLPRWSVSWGHPLQHAIRAFAAQLDAEVLATLGRLEVPGPFFGSARNYSRLATLPQPTRRHRLQALDAFPPLTAPLLLDAGDRPDMFGDSEDEATPASCPDSATAIVVLDAIDRGRDLIGALAEHHRIGRALVRSPLCRAPWAGGTALRELLRLLDAMPAHARPRDRAELENRLPFLYALPVRPRTAQDLGRLAQVFARGWNAVWQALETRFRALPGALRGTRDFLRAALDQDERPPELDQLDAESLGLAWLVRRGPASLLDASRRWHAQPAVERAPQDGLPDAVLPIVGELDVAEGHARELATRTELIAEGRAMNHCVGDYWSYCALRATRLVHLQLADGETATAQYDCARHAEPAYQLVQLCGVCNAEPSAAMDRLAERVADAMNAAGLRERRLQASCEAADASRRAERLSRPRGTLRALDPRSRQELRLVLAWCLKQEDWRSRPDELLRGCIAGFTHGDGPRLLDRLDSGDALCLVREPDNPHDPLAVRIDWNGRKLGYVPRAGNAPIARCLDAGAALGAVLIAVRRENPAWPQVEFAVTHAPD